MSGRAGCDGWGVHHTPVLKTGLFIAMQGDFMKNFSKKATKATLAGVIVLIISLILISGYRYHPYFPPDPAWGEWGQERWAELLGEQWIQDTGWWLKLGYVEEGEYAAFGQYPLHLMQPNLYVTYGAIKLFSKVGENIENPQKMACWINSLQQADGSFDCPVEGAPPLLETHWAVTSLYRLGISPEDPDKVADFLAGLQMPDGFFSLRADEPPRDEDDVVAATALAGEILLALRQENKQAAQALRVYLDSRLAQIAPPEAWDPEDVRNLLALNTLLNVAPCFTLPERYIAIPHRVVKTLPFLPLPRGDDRGIVWSFARAVNQVMEVAERAGLVLDLERIKQHIVTEIIPHLPEEGRYIFDGIIDPNLLHINALAKLTKNMGETYPGLETVIDKINRYRIDQGWISLIHTRPSIKLTYEALFIASGIGFDQFDRQKMKNYILDYIENFAGNFEEAYYALGALKLVEPSPDEGLIRNFREAVREQALNLPVGPEHETLIQYVYFIQIAQKLDLQIPPEVAYRAWYILLMLRGHVVRNWPIPLMPGTVPTYFVHAIALLQTVTEGSLLCPGEHLEVLWSERGGFRHLTYYPDMDEIGIIDVPCSEATFFALQAADETSILPDIITEERKQKMAHYFLQTKSKVGFNYVSPEMLDKYGAYVSALPTLESTMQVMRILKFAKQ